MSKNDSKKVKRLFNTISYNYDFLNNLLSLGLHNLWKKKLIKLLQPKNGESWADLCCGTGDLSFLINKKVFPNGNVIGVDNAKEILNIARYKAKKIKKNVIRWEEEDIFNLDETRRFDGICMSYGLRNLNNVENGLQKVFSLLKVNGKAGFLDFNHPPEKSLTFIFQKIYLKLIVVPIASFFNLKNEYTYIEKSIKIFPDGNNLIQIAKKIGFKKVKYITLCCGQMGILILSK